MSLESQDRFAEVTSVSEKLRSRLLEYRNARVGHSTSKHVNAVEIALCLVEFALKCTPPRLIKPEERIWFNAGREVSDIFENSEWTDITDLYFQLITAVESIDYFEATENQKTLAL